MAFDPGTLAREDIFFVSIVTVFLPAGVIVIVLRTLSLPVCRNCGFHSVRRAHSHHRALDTLAQVCFLCPHRCGKCLRRFYCFGAHRAARHSGIIPFTNDDGTGKATDTGIPQKQGLTLAFAPAAAPNPK
jgi:hypothetical protein